MPNELLLASGSPRRRELIGLLGLPCVCLSADADETVDLPDDPAASVERIAVRKAQAAQAFPESAGRTIVAADTIVVLDGEIFGKPTDREDAVAMLRRLSGREHTVMTGLCVITTDGRSASLCEHTAVRFFRLSDSRVDDSVATGEPRDKAGAYGIQGRGALLVEGITGDFYNVMGLPVARLSRLLTALGVL